MQRELSLGGDVELHCGDGLERPQVIRQPAFTELQVDFARKARTAGGQRVGLAEGGVPPALDRSVGSQRRNSFASRVFRLSRGGRRQCEIGAAGVIGYPGSVREATLYIARVDDQRRARADAGAVMDRLLDALRR